MTTEQHNRFIARISHRFIDALAKKIPIIALAYVHIKNVLKIYF